jgi:hypothetical protein
MSMPYVFAITFLMAAGVVVTGFWPTFYSDPAQNDTMRTVHGLLATVWLVLAVVQPWLIVRRRFALHRAVGRVATLVLGALVASMIATEWHMVAEPPGVGDELPVRIMIGFLGLVGIPLVVATYVWALVCARRRDINGHARLMACVVIGMAVPGIARAYVRLWGGFGPVPLGLAFATVLAALLALLIRDLVVDRRVYGGVVLNLGGQVASLVLAPLAAGMPAYMAMLRALGYPG